jgi:hypothetical protein
MVLMVGGVDGANCVILQISKHDKKVHLSSHTNKCTNIIYCLKSVLILDIKTFFIHS